MIKAQTMIKRSLQATALSLILMTPNLHASTAMSDNELKNVKKTEVTDIKEREKLSKVAGLLAEYEIEAKKLVNSLDSTDLTIAMVNQRANTLLALSETIIESARFRLPQCDEYLSKTLLLKDMLGTISNETLEKDYHHDGALPKAPVECYHTKDLFVHPATVSVLTRDDPSLKQETKDSINAEISEVLGHIELVRQLVIY